MNRNRIRVVTKKKLFPQNFVVGIKVLMMRVGLWDAIMMRVMDARKKGKRRRGIPRRTCLDRIG